MLRKLLKDRVNRKKSVLFQSPSPRGRPIPALLMALAGAFTQYFLAGCVRLIIAAERAPVDTENKAKDRFGDLFVPAFVGRAYFLVLSVLFKGLLAFLLAILIKDSTVLGVTLEKGSFVGFFTLGFLFGFWPVDKLWVEVAKMLGGRAPAENKKVTTDGREPTAGGA